MVTCYIFFVCLDCNHFNIFTGFIVFTPFRTWRITFFLLTFKYHVRWTTGILLQWHCNDNGIFTHVHHIISDSCNVVECKNGGKCVMNGKWACECKNGWTGDLCGEKGLLQPIKRISQILIKFFLIAMVVIWSTDYNSTSYVFSSSRSMQRKMQTQPNLQKDLAQPPFLCKCYSDFFVTSKSVRSIKSGKS